MKLRILSQSGQGLAVAGRLNIELDTAWSEPPSQDTIITFDTSGFGKQAEEIKKTNRVYGAGRLHDSLELNEEFGRKIAQTNGISTKEAKGPKVSLDTFFFEGIKSPIMLSSVSGEGNAFCRLWKKPDPKLYRMTVAKVMTFLSQFRYSGPLSCECVIHQKQPHFTGWVTHFQPHILLAIGPWATAVMGIEKLNGHPLSYDWLGVAKVHDPLCYVSCRGKDVNDIKDALRAMIDQISVYKKAFVDNLDELCADINSLRKDKFL